MAKNYNLSDAIELHKSGNFEAADIIYSSILDVDPLNAKVAGAPEPKDGTFKSWSARSKVKVIAGKPLDFSKWYGKAEDPAALEEATAYVMSSITSLLEELRNEKAPQEIFDPKKSQLPRTGNFKKESKWEKLRF